MHGHAFAQGLLNGAGQLPGHIGAQKQLPLFLLQEHAVVQAQGVRLGQSRCHQGHAARGAANSPNTAQQQAAALRLKAGRLKRF